MGRTGRRQPWACLHHVHAILDQLQQPQACAMYKGDAAQTPEQQNLDHFKTNRQAHDVLQTPSLLQKTQGMSPVGRPLAMLCTGLRQAIANLQRRLVIMWPDKAMLGQPAAKKRSGAWPSSCQCEQTLVWHTLLGHCKGSEEIVPGNRQDRRRPRGSPMTLTQHCT